MTDLAISKSIRRGTDTTPDGDIPRRRDIDETAERAASRADTSVAELGVGGFVCPPTETHTRRLPHNDVTAATTTAGNNTAVPDLGVIIESASGGSVDNSAGLISARHSLALRDPHATTIGNAAGKTLDITNTGGTLIADTNLNIDSRALTGDGEVLSGGGLDIKHKLLTHEGLLLGLC